MRITVVAALFFATSLFATNFVANPYVCKKCHEAQFTFWENTKHASAYLVLFAKNQHFDPSCIKCHSLGFKVPEGFQAITRPVALSEKVPSSPKRPWVEAVMDEVFVGDKKTALDSRAEPERYQKLKKKYHQALNEKQNAGEFSKVYISVQCEHCHGNREEHLRTGKRGVKFTENSCRGCHRPPNADPYDPKRLKSQSCPMVAKR